LCVVDHFSNTIWNNYNNCFDFITKVPLNEQETSLDIYPNPFSDVIRIETKVNNPAIKVYNLVGIELFSGEINDCSSVDLSFLKAGIYILAIFNDHSIERIERIIKTN
jgi:hypothetical protein